MWRLVEYGAARGNFLPGQHAKARGPQWVGARIRGGLFQRMTRLPLLLLVAALTAPIVNTVAHALPMFASRRWDATGHRAMLAIAYDRSAASCHVLRARVMPGSRLTGIAGMGVVVIDTILKQVGPVS